MRGRKGERGRGTEWGIKGRRNLKVTNDAEHNLSKQGQDYERESNIVLSGERLQKKKKKKVRSVGAGGFSRQLSSKTQGDEYVHEMAQTNQESAD